MPPRSEMISTNRLVVPALLLTALAPTTAQAALPDPARVMVEAALAGGDDAEIATVQKYAQKAWPENAAEIEAQVNAWRTAKTAAALAVASPETNTTDAGTTANTKTAEADEKQRAERKPVPWKGKGELGGYLAKGNSDYFGINAGVSLKHEGEIWRQTVKAQADYQENDGEATRQRFVFAYQPNLRVNDRTYVYGLTQYEHDRFLGYDSRYSLSTGIGYRSPTDKKVSLELEAGPAYRFTNFVDGASESTPAARGSISLEWKLAPTLTFAQNAAAYLDGLNNTVNTTSALNAKLFGPLSARLSYNVQYESAPPDGKETTDTMSRVSLVYDF